MRPTLTAIAVLFVSFALVRAQPTPPPKPEIKDAVLEKCCVELLKAQSDKLDAAGAAKKLMAWTPLMVLAGEDNAVHAAYTIKSTEWEELAHGILAVNKLVCTTLSTEALIHSEQAHKSSTTKAFWVAMSKFYSWRANADTAEKPPSPVGTWVAKNTQTGVSKTFVFRADGNGTLSFNGVSFDVKWTQNGDSFTIVHGSQQDVVRFEGKDAFKTAVGVIYKRQ